MRLALALAAFVFVRMPVGAVPRLGRAFGGWRFGRARRLSRASRRLRRLPHRRGRQADGRRPRLHRRPAASSIRPTSPPTPRPASAAIRSNSSSRRAAPRRRRRRALSLSRHALSVLREDDRRGHQGALCLFHERRGAGRAGRQAERNALSLQHPARAWASGTCCSSTRSRFTPDPAKDAQWNRGAYIVEGLGHCGTCHTPRGLAMQEKAYSNDGVQLSRRRSTIGPWRAIGLRDPDLRGRSFELLKTGADDAFDGLRPDDRGRPLQHPIFHRRRPARDGALPRLAGASRTRPPVVEAGDEKALYGTRGGLGYEQFCASCHQRDGLGAPDIFPALAGNPAFSVEATPPRSFISSSPAEPPRRPRPTRISSTCRASPA